MDGRANDVVGLPDGFHFSGVEVGHAPWVGSGSGSPGPLCAACPCVGRGGHNHACYSARQDVVCPRGGEGVVLVVVVGGVCLEVGCEDQYVETVGAYFRVDPRLQITLPSLVRVKVKNVKGALGQGPRQRCDGLCCIRHGFVDKRQWCVVREVVASGSVGILCAGGVPSMLLAGFSGRLVAGVVGDRSVAHV